MSDIIRRTYLSGSIKIGVELLTDDDGLDYYGCDVYTDWLKYPVAVHPPGVPDKALDNEDALADAARSALSFASADRDDVLGIADKAEIETVGTGCTVDRWKVEVVPHMAIFANHEGRSDEFWDRVEAAVREAYPEAELWLELDDYSGDPEITVEPAEAINELDVAKIIRDELEREA